ncbi:cadherin-23-like [Mercenaria mercenaria]|uniref:cadherin-23-like n=1 Tax=Mercenaria mercenaria TaxID=6596 RepID=UPI00234EDDA5|nr:cadherin-23-like [Mercenaria mercenaria]
MMAQSYTGELLLIILTLCVLVHIVQAAVPVFTAPLPAGTTSENINEDKVPGSLIYTAQATDADGGTITYNIQSQSPASPVRFAIDGSTGQITTTAAFDFETDAATTYTLTIEASNGTVSSTATMTVTVDNVNDNTPTFSPTVYYRTIAENTAQGTSVVLVTVEDVDTGDTVTVSISAGDDTSNKFAVGGSDGKLIETTANAIDYDSLTASNYLYTLTVIASDGSNTGTATVYVTISNVNEDTPDWGTFSPAWTSDTTAFDIAENSGVGTTIVTITATDGDSGVDGQILYSLGTVTSSSSTTVTGLFHLDQVTGILTTTSNSFDRDPATGGVEYYDVIVKAVDQGTSALSAERTVRVGLTDFNDNTPTFAQNIYSVSKAESTTAGTSLLTLAVTDNDVTASALTYSIETSSTPSAYSTYFEMDTGTTNQLNLKAVIDLDSGADATYNLIIKVSDGGSPELTSTTQVTVTMTTENENDPTFAADVTTAINEDSAVGLTVTLITATDSDTGSDGEITYSITGGNTDGKFTIDPTNGEIIISESLDYEDIQQYILTVTATDGGAPSRSDTASATINVNDVSDEKPTCTTNILTASVDEPGSVNDAVATVSCSDDDAVDTLAYSFGSSTNSAGKFAIDASGQITLADTLDYDSGTTHYALIVEITDGTTTLEVPVDVTVNPVNENTPTFGSDVDVTFAEDTAVGTALTTHAATDNDASPHNIQTYEIVSVTNSGTSLFSIDSTSGQIRLAQSLDYESQTNFVITIRAVDGGTTPGTGTGTVTIQVSDVNDVTPSCSPAAHVLSVAENTNKMLTVTYVIAATDVLQMLSVTGIVVDTDIDCYLYCCSYRCCLLPMQMLSVTCTVVDTDVVCYLHCCRYRCCRLPALLYIQMLSVTCTVVDTDVVCYLYCCRYRCYTGVDVITNFGCTDTDGPSLTYSITSQSPTNNFVIDTSGATPTLQLSSALDYETSDAFEIEVTVSDGTLSTLVYVDISVTDINDGGPSFSSTTFTASIPESAAVDTSVTTVAATDPDLSTSTYGSLTYSILSGNGDSKFNVNPSTGKISVAGVLNADATSSYSLVIQAIEDSGDNSASATVDITVTDVNDNTPTCTSDLAFSVTKAEEGTIGDTIFSLVCSDADGDTLTYTISSGGSTYFEMSGADLNLKAVVDYDTLTNPQFDFVIDVSDMTNTLTVTGSLTVTAVNEDPPAFTQTTYSVSKAENTNPGNLITTVAASDPDKDDTVTYSWVTATTDFTLDQSSGQILLAGTLDRETTPDYSLLVEASDGTNAVTATVTLTVTDENDNAPIFNPNSYR